MKCIHTAMQKSASLAVLLGTAVAARAFNSNFRWSLAWDRFHERAPDIIACANIAAVVACVSSYFATSWLIGKFKGD